MPGPNSKRVALILSGGGAKGAFQCAVERYAREAKGYQWDIIAGVSVGALNGAMLAMGKTQRLFEIWNTISNDQVYTGGFNLLSVIKLFFGARSFYGNQPLQDLLRKEFEPDKIKTDLRVGAVSLYTGEYMQFRADASHQDPDLYEAVLASTVMPVIWTPLDFPAGPDPKYLSMVDGGVRNISPVGDVLDPEAGEPPDELVIINCSPQEAGILPEPPKDVLKIGLRTLDLILNEVFINDVKEFQRLNALVQEASSYKDADGNPIQLHHPRSGRPYKYYDCKVIDPDVHLGDTLDFSQPAVQNSIKVGFRRAREVFG